MFGSSRQRHPCGSSAADCGRREGLRGQPLAGRTELCPRVPGQRGIPSVGLGGKCAHWLVDRLRSVTLPGLNCRLQGSFGQVVRHSCALYPVGGCGGSVLLVTVRSPKPNSQDRTIALPVTAGTRAIDSKPAKISLRIVVPAFCFVLDSGW